MKNKTEAIEEKSVVQIAIEKAVQIAGSQALLAEKIGCNVKQAHISNWINRNKRVPEKHAFAIANAVDWQVTPHELCPKSFPANLTRPNENTNKEKNAA
jgi:DNA-binding transcriptional regulator YdaS (Cro superfamily)